MGFVVNAVLVAFYTSPVGAMVEVVKRQDARGIDAGMAAAS
jgi:hypothetical protein